MIIPSYLEYFLLGQLTFCFLFLSLTIIFIVVWFGFIQRWATEGSVFSTTFISLGFLFYLMALNSTYILMNSEIIFPAQTLLQNADSFNLNSRFWSWIVRLIFSFWKQLLALLPSSWSGQKIWDDLCLIWSSFMICKWSSSNAVSTLLTWPKKT